MKRILFLVRKELWQVFRDSNMLRVVFIVPVVQLLVLGYAITTDIKNLDITISDYDQSGLSRNLSERFLHSEYFKVTQARLYPGEAEKQLFNGRAVLVLTIPLHFENDLELGRSPQVQILVDGQNSNSSAVAMGYTSRILLEFMQELSASRLLRGGTIDRQYKMIRAVSRAWYNPELKSIFFMIPGIVSVLLTIITMLLTGLAIRAQSTRQMASLSFDHIVYKIQLDRIAR